MNAVATCATESPFYGPPPSHLRGKRRCHLVLLVDSTLNQQMYFSKIAAYVRQFDPKVHTTIVTNRWRGLAQLIAGWNRPTLIFSAVPLARFRPLRGCLVAGQNLTKSQEYSALEAGGFRVPKWQLVPVGDAPDLCDYGPYVVVKPNSGGSGALVKIKKANRFQARRGELSQSKNESTGALQRYSNADGMLAQQFIYTGQWPVSYRVTTLFGHVMDSLRIESNHERTPLAGPNAFNDTPGVSIVASSKNCNFSLNFDEEIIRLGQAAHAAFPSIPLLGVDIVREIPSGKLFILEVNAIGSIWHLASETGLRLQRESGINLENQFDALRKAAHILAEKTQQLAR